MAPPTASATPVNDEQFIPRYEEPYPWWCRVPFVSLKPKAPPASLADAPGLPEDYAPWLSRLTFWWLNPLLSQGYSRPLQATDMYQLGESRAAHVYSSRLQDAFERRRAALEDFKTRVENNQAQPPSWRRFLWRLTGSQIRKEEQWRRTVAKRQPSLAGALNDTIFWWFWIGGLYKGLADAGLICSPLLVKALINFASESYAAHLAGTPAPSIGKGLGLAFGLLALQWLIMFLNVHAFHRSFTTGVLLRTALITSVFSRALSLTSRARTVGGMTAGKFVGLISTDISRIDYCSGYFHMAWTAPLQMVICLIILCINLGWSALPGLAFFVILSPLQGKITQRLFLLRKRSMVWTEKRIKALHEILGAMRIIKLFAWELPFMDRIGGYRKTEMSYLRSRLTLRSFNNAFAFSLPTLASVVSFVVYSASGHSLEPGIIFSSLSLFVLLRTPMTFLPVALNAITDASTAVQRLQPVFMAETRPANLPIEPDLPVAIQTRALDLTWDSPPPVAPKAAAVPSQNGLLSRLRARFGGAKPVVTPLSSASEKPLTASIKEAFKMNDVNLEIPRGQLCAIVGPVGSGKSSLLQGLIGEMRKTGGDVRFGGTVGYCPQTAWIQSISIRDNITFGQPYNEKKYQEIVQQVCLQPDFDMLPHGDLTEVGEKGISLSGGQKQRINIARALYFGCDITLFDDSFSALDAHVGKAVFDNVVRAGGALDGRTRVLVTHKLDFLPHVDYIITLSEGKITEQGTYTDLMAANGFFARFISEFSNNSVRENDTTRLQPQDDKKVNITKNKITPSGNATMMQNEERATGSVSWKVYKAYFSAANIKAVFPLLLLAISLFQGASVMSPYWLVFWQENRFPIKQGVYMAIYAILGFAQAFGLFCMGGVFAILTFHASQSLHRDALDRILHAPISFFDTTPLGRIMNRFSKDVDTIDNVIGDACRMFIGTLVQIIGAVVLISVIQPWFLLAVGIVLLAYYWIAMYYRASAREVKRIDAVLRSSLYAHFGEAIGGISTIHAYQVSGQFKRENEHRMDLENRAYWITTVNQRWLSLRLDFLGSLLLLAVSLLCVGARFTISPAQTGVVVSYMLTIQASFGWAVRQSAEIENNMNGVERIVFYAKETEQEASHDAHPGEPDSSTWPLAGEIIVQNAVVRYRPELPPVLNGLSLTIRGGEHVGIVGRTGAGKSTVTQALFRMMELSSGSIMIDGVDIGQLGLRKLRSALTIIPQDPLLFSGTLRYNLDPFSVYDDARLWDALRRAHLVEPSKSGTSIEKASGTGCSSERFTLDMQIQDGGSNLSVGERSLVNLARALVRDTRIVLMDEATASVDYKTDRDIQTTIQEEFKNKTLLCIAHRLQTIIGYDKICVIDNGRVAEFDSPAKLFENKDSIFYGMCKSSGITFEDVANATR
ncbi:ABC transporter protein YOR1, putative [Rhizoctonia solani AG-3 Rhs1AP]|uniref:ABC transporter protein YOR1, putative n=1 Tax=Rhizoctonia solani AG-3 Rhs1AP TaxID=1086054 RepID=X8JQ93_9AGAM|nr:ABC transporter protein YOR1, putative [Rhizoctonia solani AG-3 Rhs1AP]